MRRIGLLAVAVAFIFTATAGVASAQTQPEFKLGFKALADQVPATVGRPLEEEHWGANGDSLQQTTTGLMAWRKADNWTAFTDGARTWVNGPMGVVERANDESFDWEAATSVPASPAPPGYRYIDPNAIVSNPSAYIGQKVVLEGQVGKHVWPNGASYIEFFPYGEIRTDVWHAPWFGVQFFSYQPIQKFDSIRVYGTITGEKTEVIRQPGELTYILISVRINGDRWEPIPLAGGQTPAVQNQRLMVLLSNPGAAIDQVMKAMNIDPDSPGPYANYLRSHSSMLEPAYYLQQGDSKAPQIQSSADYLSFANNLLTSMGGSLGNVRGQVMSALGAAPGQSQGWNTMLSGIDPSTGQPYLTDQERQDWVNRLMSLVNKW